MNNPNLAQALHEVLGVDQILARMKAGATILPSTHPQGKYFFEMDNRKEFKRLTLGPKKMEAKIRRRRRMR